MRHHWLEPVILILLVGLQPPVSLAQEPVAPEPAQSAPAPQPVPAPQPEPQPYPQAQPQAYPQAQGSPPTYQQPTTQLVYVEEAEPEGPGKFRIPFFLKFGVGGTMNLTIDDVDAGSADLGPTVGGGVGLTFILFKYLGLGPRISVNRLQADGASVDDDGILAIDLSVAPEVRFPFAENRFAIYGVVPIGLTVFRSERDGAESELGLNIGIMGGAEFFLGRRFGLFAEVGYQGRFYGETVGGVDYFLSISEASVTVGGKLAF